MEKLRWQIELSFKAEETIRDAKKNWVFELHSILWAFWSTPRTPTVETLFILTFETEAVVPIELQIPTHRVQFNDENLNSKKLRSNLDAFEEARDEA